MLIDMTENIAPPPGKASIVSPIDSSALQQDQSKIKFSIKMRASLQLLAPTKSPTETSQTYSSASRDQESPATSQGPLQSLHIPITDRGRSVSPGSQTGSVSDMHEHILLVSPQPRKPPDAFNNHPDPTPVQATTPALGQPPSLEQPFKGVGKLIEQWQKKTEEAERKGQVGVKPTEPQRLRRPPVKLTAAS
jgi:AP2-associated kinase